MVAGERYLALGDSVTFGYMEPAVVPTPDYFDARSFIGYPEVLGAELRLRVANAACTGETSASFIDPAARSDGCSNRLGDPAGGYRMHYPLHVSYTASQLAYAVGYLRHHHDVGLVSLMIGTNDLFLCAITTSDGCQSPDELAVVASSLRRHIATILWAIRNEARYPGQLAIVNYYSLNYASGADDRIAQFLNRNQDLAAKRFHVAIADGYGAFASAASDSAGDPCKAGLLTQLAGGGCGGHPSYSGQVVLAQAVVRVLKLG